MEETKKCPKCNSEMEEGVTPDYSSSFNIPNPQKWMTKIRLLTLVRKDESKKVKTFRCKSCGYLESYAK